MTAPARSESLTGDPLTDALVPLVVQLSDAVFAGDAKATARIRRAAEDVVFVHGGDPAEAGWAVATVAAGMLPGGAPPRLLLAWRLALDPEVPVEVVEEALTWPGS